MEKENDFSEVKKIFLFLSFIVSIGSLCQLLVLDLIEVSDTVYRFAHDRGWYIGLHDETMGAALWLSSISVFLCAVIYFIFFRKTVSLPTKISLLILGAANPFLYLLLYAGKYNGGLFGGKNNLHIIGCWLLAAITFTEIIMLIREAIVNLKDKKTRVKNE